MSQAESGYLGGEWLLVYVNAKFQQAFGCSWANELTKKLGLEAWRCSSGGFSLSNPSYTYTETDVMWEVRAIFFHMLLG
jgi:hypothetical protein